MSRGSLFVLWMATSACSTENGPPPPNALEPRDGGDQNDAQQNVSGDSAPNTDATVPAPSKFPVGPFVSVEIGLSEGRTTVIAYDPFTPNDGRCETRLVRDCVSYTCSNLGPVPAGGFPKPAFAKGTILLTNKRTGQVFTLGGTPESSLPGYVFYINPSTFPVEGEDPVRVQWTDNDQLPSIDWETSVPPAVSMAVGTWSPAAGAPLSWVKGNGEVRMRLAQFEAGLNANRVGGGTCFFDRMLGASVLPQEIGASLRTCDLDDAGTNRFTVGYVSGGSRMTTIYGLQKTVVVSLSAHAAVSRQLSCSN